MDPARRWQVASMVTAAASIGVGAFALQRPSYTEVEPIDLDVIGVQSGEVVDLPTLPLSPDTVIVAPDLLEQLPTGPSPASTTSPVAATSVASTASPAEPSPSPTTAVSAASVASPDEATTSSVPASRPTQRADDPASVASPADPASPPDPVSPSEPASPADPANPASPTSVDSED
ncbi:MAG: hypothetical protein WD378_05850 [Egicoccus sp.]